MIVEIYSTRPAASCNKLSTFCTPKHLRAFLLENKNQVSFVDQYLAAGAFNSKLKMLYDRFFPGNRSGQVGSCTITV